MQYFRLLRNPIAFFMWFGQALSAAGDRIYVIAAMWLALRTTHSPMTMALTSLSENIALMLVGTVAGGFIDRWNKSRTMVIADVSRAAIVLMIPLFALHHQLHTWSFVLLGVLMGSFGAVFSPALQASLVELLPARQFSSFVGLMDTPSRLARILGPGLSGVLYAILPLVQFFTIDSGTFLVSALCVTLVQIRIGHKNSSISPTVRKRFSIFGDSTKGFRILIQHHVLRTIFLCDSVGDALYTAFPLCGILISIHNYHGGIGTYGSLVAAYGIGSLFGNSLAGNIELVHWRTLFCVGGWLGIGMGFIILGLSSSPFVGFAAMVMAGVFGSAAHVCKAVYIGQNVPAEHLGKVYSLDTVLGTASNSIGLAGYGWALGHLPAMELVLASGILMLVISLLSLTSLVRHFPWVRRPVNS